MTNTTYYNLNIVEGTDIVNPLTVDNPNYEKIDEAMHDNAISGVTLATEIANATVHAITRENSECAVIRFIATSNWKAGDTVTVDSVPVTALLPSGETLPDGAYVINANVLCILTGTNLTVYAERKKIDNASEIRYNGTNVASAITKINTDLTPVKNHLTGGYTITELDVYKYGKEQNISATITFPIDVKSANSYFTIGFVPISPAFVNVETFTGSISYGNKVIPAIYRINANKDIQIFLSDEIVSLGSVFATAYINVSYRIA